MMTTNQFDLPACRADDEKTSSLWRILLEKNEEGLQRQVGVARTDRTVVEQTLNVVHKNAEDWIVA